MIGDKIAQQLYTLREQFVSTILYVADASPDDLRAMGVRSKEHALELEAQRYRANLRKIFND